ncbi:MAG: toxic anion resistance protein [Oscillospiraceae bacterium]|nr:toxic anion resistance protein [Oscillospiraceae bacterium]
MDEQILEMEETVQVEEPTVPEETPAAQVEEPAQSAPVEDPAVQEEKLTALMASHIDMFSAEKINRYGADAQIGLAKFADTAVNGARNRAPVELDRRIGELMTEIKNFDAVERSKMSFLASLFFGASKYLEQMRQKHAELTLRVEALQEKTEDYGTFLSDDFAQLDELYNKNEDFLRALTIYVNAGRLRLRREKETTLASMREIAKRTDLPLDAENVRAFEANCRLLETKLYDLERTKTICQQLEPQLRYLKNGNKVLADKLSECLSTALPAWHSATKEALHLPAREEDATEKLTVDKETLQKANGALLSALDDVLQVRAEVSQKRREAERELQNIEGHMRMKLLELENQ